MKKSLILGKFLLVEVIYLKLVLVEFNSAGVDTHDISRDSRYKESQHEGTWKLTQSESYSHIEDCIAKEEVEGKFCFVYVSV